MLEMSKVGFFFFVVFCLRTGNGLRLKGISQEPQKSKYWDTLILTQSWPPATCILFEHEKRHCNLSSPIRSWVIHGLWPTKNGTEEPNYCNDTWKFEVDKVKSLLTRMNLNWPSIDAEEKPIDAWTHEWTKHGTCATALPALKDEFHYFNVTLNLHDQYNLTQFFSNSSIIPSEDQSYKSSDLLEALQQKIGAYPLISCVKDEDNGRYYMEQIEICMTKLFKPANCASASSQRSALDLLFQSEMTITRRGRSSVPGSFIRDCGDGEEIYYKPFSSLP